MTDENKTGEATYCPEDNKLRLYVGRVPREEYLALRAEGWTSTPKQDCDFVATWTPARRDRALQYAELIGDEDQAPEDRAADRAERFGEYRDKRTNEATGHADTYEAGPQAHGYQSAARAERSARRHDRSASYACDAWSKADYWQRRTAGVISNALYKSTPGVRMGRIKTIEADLRRTTPGSSWNTHLTLRLAYENQMLEAQGGRAAFVEMVPGGFLGARQIQQVNKSNATGRVVSVIVKDNQPSNVNHWGNPWTDGIPKILSHTIKTERLPANAYRPPTPEELAEFHAAKKAAKAARPKADTIPLINPTDADAERLQAIWNAARSIAWRDEEKPCVRMTQAQYSQLSKGSYARAEAKGLAAGGLEPKRVDGSDLEPVDFKVRFYGRSVIVLTDKPQKPLPPGAFESPRAAQLAIVQDQFGELQEVCKLIAGSYKGLRQILTEEQRELFRLARLVGYAYYSSLSQNGLTPAGNEYARQAPAKPILAALMDASESFALEVQ